MTRLSRLQVLCTAALLTSCVDVHNQKYPDDWPRLVVNAEGCTPVSGTFQSQAIDGSNSLATWFVSSVDSLDSVDRLDFPAAESGAFRFRFLSSDNRVLLDRTWHEGTEYRCARGAMEWHMEGFTKYIGVASNDLVLLQRNVRGDLVICEAGAAGGVIMVVPVYIGGRSWHAYPRVTE